MVPDFVAMAHQCEGIGEFEAAVLDALGRTVGFDAAFVLVAGQQAHLTAVGLGAPAIENLKLYASDYGAEIAAVKRVALAERGVAIDTEVLGERAVRRSRYFSEVVRSISGRHGLLGYLRKGRQPYGLILLGRCGRSFSRAEREYVENSLPVLSLARAAFHVPWAAGALPPAEPMRRGLARFLSGRGELGRTSLSDGELLVRECGGWREMVAKAGSDEPVWSRVGVTDSSRSGWAYADLFHVALARAPARRRVLMIGCGGGVSVRQLGQLYPGIEIDVVEREPSVAEHARRFFGVADVPRTHLHVADGKTFVERAGAGLWDAVIVDAFDATAFDAAFAHPAFIGEARRVLTGRGTLGINLIDSLRGGTTLPAFVAAARRSFDDLRITPVLNLREEFSPVARRNLVVVGVRRD
jgi:Spermine/spermidine synthase domain